jgi:hypothetical protein
MRLQNFSNIAELIKQNFYYLPIKVVITDKKEKDFNNQIINYVRENKKHSIVHSEKDKF